MIQEDADRLRPFSHDIGDHLVRGGAATARGGVFHPPNMTVVGAASLRARKFVLTAGLEGCLGKRDEGVRLTDGDPLPAAVNNPLLLPTAEDAADRM